MSSTFGTSRGPRSTRTAIAWLAVALTLVLGLYWHKERELSRFADRALESLSRQNEGFKNLFRASFYFFYAEQFVPGVERSKSEVEDLKRVLFLDSSASVLFDSRSPDAYGPNRKSDGPRSDGELGPKVTEALKQGGPTLFFRNFEVQILIPSGDFSVLYFFDARALRQRITSIFLGFVFLSAAVFFAWRRWGARSGNLRRWLAPRWAMGLRSKFLATILVINGISSLIIFVTLTELQTREQTERIEKDSVLFAQFSTNKVISDFELYFYFYYQDKFLPGIRSIISTNENLLGIRVISNRKRVVLFDSRTANESTTPAQEGDGERIALGEELESMLKSRGFITRTSVSGGERVLSVINTFHSQNQEALFLVEYLFTFQSLKRSVALIRQQILIDLVPSLAIGLIIAIAFAQLLISPIRRLVSALAKVTEGDYTVSVELKRSDEIGDLLAAFNSMTSELRKKKELRKYLSDSTYRQVMEAAETNDGARLKGTRVSATVLFSDIRNFVGHCEALDAEEVTSMLNEYFSEMVEVVYKHGGEVDKFIGDAILAVFYSGDETRTIRSGDQIQGPSATSTSLQAIYCALEMRERLKDFNRRRLENQKSVIEIGVGITHGEIISGPIGAKDRMDFTVIGDVVNLANRIEKVSKLGKYTRIVFSNHVEQRVRGLLEYEEISREKIRGKEEEVTVFELKSVRELGVLLENLKSGDLSLRVRSLELLGQSRNLDAIPHVIQALSDPEESIRREAISSLIKLSPANHEPVLDALFGALENEASDRVVSALIAAIGRTCSTHRVLKLSPYLGSKDDRIVSNAIEAIGQARDPQAADTILPLLYSRNNRVKANAAMALFASGRIEVISTLKPMLLHSDPLMRSSAAFAIGELTIIAQKDKLLEELRLRGHEVKMFLAELQECVPMLVSLLKDAEPIVKRQAIIALGKIRDKSSVLPIIDTLDLERDNKELIQDIARSLRAIGSHKLVREVLDKLS